MVGWTRSGTMRIVSSHHHSWRRTLLTSRAIPVKKAIACRQVNATNKPSKKSFRPNANTHVSKRNSFAAGKRPPWGVVGRRRWREAVKARKGEFERLCILKKSLASCRVASTFRIAPSSALTGSSNPCARWLPEPESTLLIMVLKVLDHRAFKNPNDDADGEEKAHRTLCSIPPN